MFDVEVLRGSRESAYVIKERNDAPHDFSQNIVKDNLETCRQVRTMRIVSSDALQKHSLSLSE